MVRNSQLRNLCLVALLLPLPLLYLLHIEMNSDYHTQRDSRDTTLTPLHTQRDSRDTTLTPLHSQRDSRDTTTLTPLLPDTSEQTAALPAIVRKILVREIRRPHRQPDNSASLEKKKCKSRICREFLTKRDMGYFGYCWRKTHLNREPSRSHCRFLNTTSRFPVALASFPGSGNTWVRGLLQRATGACTGGVYCDTKLRVSGYPGESIRSGRTLVVKTHQVDPRWRGVIYPLNTTDSYFTKESDIPVYESGILLVRNPYHALVAEWNRLTSINMSVSDNHINSIDTRFFGQNVEWDRFVLSNAVTWQETVVGWLVQNHGHQVMVVRYEDLQRNIESEIMMILDFLGYPYSLVSVAKQLKSEYNEFHRKSYNATTFDHFTKQQIQFVETIIHNTAHILKSHRLLDTCDITTYLHHRIT